MSKSLKTDLKNTRKFSFNSANLILLHMGFVTEIPYKMDAIFYTK